MGFWQQLLLLLSQSPGSLVYHVVSLLALQATLGLALWQRRRDPADAFAARLVWAAGGILVARLLVFFALLLVRSENELVGLTAPLERAIDAATTVLLLWALIPRADRYLRLSNVVAITILFLIGLVTFFFYQEWSAAARTPVVQSYGTSGQAAFWEISQVVVLSLSLALFGLRREGQWSLKAGLIGVLLVSHVASLAFDTDLMPGTDANYWVRLGNLAALPLLAVLAYRHNLSNFAPGTTWGRTHAAGTAVDLESLQRIIAQPNVPLVVDRSFPVIQDLLSPEFAAVGIRSDESDQRLDIYIRRQSGTDEDHPREAPAPLWALSVPNWPALETALERQESVQLLPDGLGSRQLHELYQELHVLRAGPLLVEPLQLEGESLGVLMLATSPKVEAWAEADRMVASDLARFLSQAIHNVRTRPPARAAVAEKLKALALARQEAERQAGTLRHELAQTEALLAGEKSRAKELADTLEKASPAEPQARVNQLEAQVETLRAKLARAERALALLAAGKSARSASGSKLTLEQGSSKREEIQITPVRLEQRLDNHDGSGPAPPVANQPTEVREVIEAAIDSVGHILESKRIVLDLDLAKQLPLVNSDRDTFLRLVCHALENACRVTGQGGHVLLRAHPDRLTRMNTNGGNPGGSFVHLDIMDGGGAKSQQIHALIRRAQRQPDDKELQERVARTGVHLAAAIDLVASQGGRAWVHGDQASGSTFSALLPASMIREPSRDND